MKTPHRTKSPLWLRWYALLFATTAAGWSADALAQQAQQGATAQPNSEVIIVTAQKRAQNLQDVPISMQAITTEQLDQLNITDFTSLAKFAPSLSVSASYGPGYNRPFMRGVASGENGNHSGSQPSVGMYLDEQPITTITGNLDLHVYDLARVEVLEGPQGTLYGASSESGTIRLITNQPDPDHFSGSADFTANSVDHGSAGGTAEGYVNIPLSSHAAIRLVGWDEHDAGFIDNVHRRRTYVSNGVVDDNAALVEKDYNDADTIGARAALKIDLDENWTVTPQVMAQNQTTHGVFAQDATIGDLKVAHFFPEYNHDNWVQAALTVQGEISNFDITATAAHLRRAVNNSADYSDYAYFYDVAYFSQSPPTSFADYFYDNAGNPISPGQVVLARDRYWNSSYELRVASPVEGRLRFIGGLFYQANQHRIYQRYFIPNLADSLEVPGWPDTIWLTLQMRKDTEAAVFGELSYDFTPKLTGTIGARVFRTEGSLAGFFGYGAGFSSSQGEATCFEQPSVSGAPCNDLDKNTSETGQLFRANLQYHLDSDRMIYATFSQGFRPGGLNRRAALAPYQADYLDNYEAGWKTEWDAGRLRWNGAVFFDQWRSFQYAFLAPGSVLTQIQNAGDADIKGVETDLTWYPIEHLSINASATFLHTELTSATIPDTVKGERLPTSPNIKADLTGRYEFTLGGWDAFLQASASYQGDSLTDLRQAPEAVLGRLPSFTLVDFSAGAQRDVYRFSIFVNNLLDERAFLSRYVECNTLTCGPEPYNVVAQPRTIGVKLGRSF